MVKLSKEVIHVGLYGGKGLFGGKETALEASIVQCDKFDKCSFFLRLINVRVSDRCHLLLAPSG